MCDRGAATLVSVGIRAVTRDIERPDRPLPGPVTHGRPDSPDRLGPGTWTGLRVDSGRGTRLAKPTAASAPEPRKNRYSAALTTRGAYQQPSPNAMGARRGGSRFIT